MEKKFIGIDFLIENKISVVFFRAFINTNVTNGRTGTIEFNERGVRIESLYDIINIQHGQFKVVGSYRSNTVSLSRIY